MNRRPSPLMRVLAGGLSATLLTLTCLPSSALAQERRIRFFHPDHLGSTHVVTDETGQVVEVIEYKPFGEVYKITGPDRVPHTFTGQRLDDSTGLYFYHARYYDPQLGRFIQPDTIVQDPEDPQTLNRYTYVRNNPVNLVDPSGNFFQFIIAAIVAAIKAAAIGAAIGAAVNATVAAFTGQPVGKAALQGAAVGAAFGGTFAFGGTLLGPVIGAGGIGATLGKLSVLAAAGAVSGGVGSSLQGGSFGHGAAVGALTAVATFGLVKGTAAALGEFAHTQIGQAATGAAHAGGARLSQVFRQLLNQTGVGAAQGSIVEGVGNASALFNLIPRNVSAIEGPLFSAPQTVVRFATSPFRTGLQALGQRGGFFATTVEQAEQFGGLQLGSFRVLIGPQARKAIEQLALDRTRSSLSRGLILYGRTIGVPQGARAQFGFVQTVKELIGGAQELFFQ